jgi:hypothetical protein
MVSGYCDHVYDAHRGCHNSHRVIDLKSGIHRLTSEINEQDSYCSFLLVRFLLAPEIQAVSGNAIYLATIWAIPVIIAITFHEAANGFVAHLLGDDTAWRLGRVSFNPAKHIDPFGTILLPGILLLLRAPFLFGYAKPVLVNFQKLRSPRRDMVLVAAAGPAMNIVLAVLAALAFHLVGYLPVTAARWLADNLMNALSLRHANGRFITPGFCRLAPPRTQWFLRFLPS